MKKLAALTLSMFLVSGTAFADTPKNADSQPATAAQPAKPKAAKNAESSNAAIAAQLEELRQTLQSQQEQLQMLKEELAKRDRQIDEAREAGPPAIKYKGINITPVGFIAAETVFRQRATSGDIPTPMNAIPYPGNALSRVTESNFSGRQSRIGLLGDTKVGSAKVSAYYEADFFGAGTTSNNRQTNSYVLRQRQLWGQAAFDNGWQFTGGQMWTLATETRKGIQNRQEVLPMTIDVNYTVGFTYARGYGFRAVKDLGATFAVGVSVEGPQSTFGGRGFSSFTTAAGAVTQNFFINAPGAGGGLYNAFDATGYTVNKAPDFVFKAAADPGYGHYELFGILSTFRNRIYPCGVISYTANGTVITAANGNTTTFTGNPITCAALAAGEAPSVAGAFNDSRTGGGFGAVMRIPLFSKKLDFGVKGLAGDGVGRYGAAQLADMTFRPDGTAALIRTAHGLGTLEFHPTPKLDIYFNYGGEYGWRAAYTGYNSVKITATSVTGTGSGAPLLVNTVVARTTGAGGYGGPTANNNTCGNEAVPAGSSTPGAGACAGDIRFIQEGTLGFWHKMYQGPKGGVRWGLQYSYITKSGWSGAGGIQPKAVDNMVFTSFRYYLP